VDADLHLDDEVHKRELPKYRRLVDKAEIVDRFRSAFPPAGKVVFGGAAGSIFGGENPVDSVAGEMRRDA